MYYRKDSADALYTVTLMEHITDAGVNFNVEISIYTAKSTQAYWSVRFDLYENDLNSERKIWIYVASLFSIEALRY